jgi:hypothetical protein
MATKPSTHIERKKTSLKIASYFSNKKTTFFKNEATKLSKNMKN